jgi:hypothetical protein
VAFLEDKRRLVVQGGLGVMGWLKEGTEEEEFACKVT